MYLLVESEGHLRNNPIDKNYHLTGGCLWNSQLFIGTKYELKLADTTCCDQIVGDSDLQTVRVVKHTGNSHKSGLKTFQLLVLLKMLKVWWSSMAWQTLQYCIKNIRSKKTQNNCCWKNNDSILESLFFNNNYFVSTIIFLPQLFFNNNYFFTTIFFFNHNYFLTTIIFLHHNYFFTTIIF